MDEKAIWYLARASGIVAWALVSASVLWGLLLSTRLLGRTPSPAWFLDLHRWLGGLSVTFTLVHVVALMFDPEVPFSLLEVLVPGAADWNAGAVAWGVVGFWLLLAVQITSLLMRKLPRKLWARVHQVSYAVFLVASIHLFTAGSDADHPALRILAALIGAGVLFLWLVSRLSPRGEAARAARAQREHAPRPRPASAQTAAATSSRTAAPAERPPPPTSATPAPPPPPAETTTS